MSGSERYARFFAAESWKRLYEALPNANFAGYDFNSLRDAMLGYVRRNFPEDYNDFVESSEFYALVEVLAFLGQSLAFRTDFDVRENFIDHAERRESLLRLARFVGYRVGRRRSPFALARVRSLLTTLPVTDPVDGRSLSGRRVVWNDATDPDWFDRWVAILDTVLTSGNHFGLPVASGTDADGVAWQRYLIRRNSDAVVHAFDFPVAGNVYRFEIVGVDVDSLGIVHEVEPLPGSGLAALWRSDGEGYAGADTGLFVGIRQGTLSSRVYRIDDSVENLVITLDVTGVDDRDVWVQSVDEDGNVTSSWTRVPSVHGLNVVYSGLPVDVRDIFADRTEPDDGVSLVFGDGRFGAIPRNLLRVWARVVADDVPDLRPADIRGTTVVIPVSDASGRSGTLALELELTRSVPGSAPGDDADRLRTTVPAVIYAQDRMVSGEDYSVLPLIDGRIVRLRATLTTYSAHSRHTDLRDPTGTVTPLRIFAEDGILHRDVDILTIRTTASVAPTTAALIANVLEPAMNDPGVRNFVVGATLRAARFDPDISAKLEIPGTGIMWDRAGSAMFALTGRFVAAGPVPVPADEPALRVGTGTTVSSALGAIRPNSLIRFRDAGWVRVVSIRDDGSGSGNGFDPDGRGKVELASPVEEGDLVAEVLPAIRTGLTQNEIADISSRIATARTFALGWDPLSGRWAALQPPSTGTRSFDSLAPYDRSDPARAWMILFENIDGDPTHWNIHLRRWTLQLFSKRTVEFHARGGAVRYDPELGETVGDHIEIVRANVRPPVDRASIPPWDPGVAYEAGSLVTRYGATWEAIIKTSPGIFDPAIWRRVDVDLDRAVRFAIHDIAVLPSGAPEPRAAVVSYADFDGDGIPSDPDAFDLVVYGDDEPDDLAARVQIVWRVTVTTDGREVREPVDDALVFRGTTIDDALAAMDAHYLSDATRGLWKDGTVGVALDDRGEAAYRVFDIDNVYGSDDSPPAPLAAGDPLVPSAQQVGDPESYDVTVGRRDLRFVWRHWPEADVRIDPSPTAIVRIDVVTRSWLDSVRRWVAEGADPAGMPEPPDPEELRLQFADLERKRAVADFVLWHHARPVPLFGRAAREELQATLVVVPGERADEVGTGAIRHRVAEAANEYLDPAAWDIGETVYFTGLSAYIVKKLGGLVASVALVPRHPSAAYGDLHEIPLEPDGVPVGVLTSEDVRVVSANSAETLRIFHRSLD